MLLVVLTVAAFVRIIRAGLHVRIAGFEVPNRANQLQGSIRLQSTSRGVAGPVRVIARRVVRVSLALIRSATTCGSKEQEK